jgi:rod shape-determining protein MreD
MEIVTRLIPGVLVVLLTLLVAAPWGLGAAMRQTLPMLPLLAIVHGCLRQPQFMPAGLAFASGIALDVLTHGPLGYWSLVFLSAHLAARSLPAAAEPTLSAELIRAAAAIAVAVSVQWVTTSVYRLEPAATLPLLLAGAAAMAAYPIATLILGGIAQLVGGRRRRQLRLERGG